MGKESDKDYDEPLTVLVQRPRECLNPAQNVTTFPHKAPRGRYVSLAAVNKIKVILPLEPGAVTGPQSNLSV